MTKGRQPVQNPRGGGRYNVRAIERAILVLGAFSREKNRLKLDEITRETGLSKPTVFRILATLEHHGYVVHDPEDGRYRLGSVFLTLGGAVLASMSLRRLASPHLNRLRDALQVTVLLGALVDDALVYIDKKESAGPVRIASDIGWRRDPPHFGMLGMTLLAYREPGEIARLLERFPPRPYTRNSLVRLEELTERFRRIREQGYVVESEEAIAGVWGVAAPILDATGEVVAAVGVAQSTNHKSPSRLDETIAAVRECAEAVSSELGFVARPSA